MAVFHPIQVTCSCGNTFQADLARSVNVKRNRKVRDQILDGSFHRVVCPSCAKKKFVERPFYYTDPAGGAMFLVQPRGYRYEHTRDGIRLGKQKKECDILLRGAKTQQVRVVYGLDELREKLIAQDHGYDDRHIELIKTLVIYDHPFLLKTTRLQLVLKQITGMDLIFVAYYHNQPRSFECRFPRILANDILRNSEKISHWISKAGHRESILAKDRHWVNIRRWTTRYSSLDALREYAKEINAGGEVNFNSQEFRRMADRLPRGSQLPAWAKKDLRVLFDHALATGDSRAQDRLFEVRYGVELEDEWATNSDPNDIDTIWKLLRDVPIDNVEGNTKLVEIELISGGGGTYESNGVIQIGEMELSSKERFEDTLRHEVGHAVHEQRKKLVDGWLSKEFGWTVFENTNEGVNNWIDLMGGWKTVPGITEKQKREIVRGLRTAVGPGGTWDEGPNPNLPQDHPWNSKKFGPREAYEKSRSDWYRYFKTWHRANGMAFFLNYWYATFMAVSEEALQLVSKMPSSYAAMSDAEFFAELYALFYDQGDPKRKLIPASIGKWLEKNIGKISAGNPKRTTRRVLRSRPRTKK